MIKNNRIPVVALMLVFILPVLISWFLYYNHAAFHLKTANRGTLVNPALNVGDIFFKDSTQKLWRIVYLPGKTCDQQCSELNQQLQQIPKALGKDYARVTVLEVAGDYNSLEKLFAAQGSQSFAAAHKIYLIDPLGNLFMYYPSTTNRMNILKDLKKVLEVSQIG
jgi:hypothetical protein